MKKRMYCINIFKYNLNFNKTTRLYSKALEHFLKKHDHLTQIKKYIPAKYLNISTKIANDHLYLICPNAAKVIADHVENSITGNQIVAETNTGLGLITTELLDRGIPQVRMYETCPDFRESLKTFSTVYPGRVELFTKNIFHLKRFAFMDKQDGNNRVDALLKNVPKKSWTDDPCMTIIGPMPGTNFIKYLMRSLALQTGPPVYGRIQMFAILRKRDYEVLTATPEQNLRLYQHTSVIFQLLFDFEKLETFPRNIFVPWERAIKNRNMENEEMVLLKINFKKEFEIPASEILPLFYFTKQFYGTGNNLIIPTVEKWVPGCGVNVFIPKFKHTDYFSELNIFTKFRELTPSQILSIFKEMINSRGYIGSPFTAMVESELVKTETIETGLADAVLEKRISKDVENLNYQNDFD